MKMKNKISSSASIVEQGKSSYNHFFGGSAWIPDYPTGAVPPPLLLITLDRRDPKLGALSAESGEIPLVSRVDGMELEPQIYSINMQASQVVFMGKPWNCPVDPRDALPEPLPLRSVRLRNVMSSEDPLVISKYDVQDTMLGGEAFIRVGGDPIWLTDGENVVCECGKDMQFVASVGYENYDAPSGFIDKNTPFFIGELALYFFICQDCMKMNVLSQPS